MTTNPADARTSGTLRRIAAALFAVYLVIAGALAWRAPTWEWDLLGYVGCVEELRGAKADAVHSAVYEQLAEFAPAQAAEELRSKNEYRARLTQDAAAFDAQLPFYRGRVLFIGSLAALSELGLPTVRAAFLVSVLAGLAFAALAFVWCQRLVGPLGAAFVTVAMLELAHLRDVMSLATPDALAAGLVLGGAYCVIERSRWKTGLTLWILAVAARTDHVLLIAPLLFWLALAPRDTRAAASDKVIDRGKLFLSLGALAATLYFCTAARGTYSWWTVFHHTFFGYKTFPASETPDMDFFAALKHGLRSLPQFKALAPLAFTLLGLGVVILGVRAKSWRSRSAGLAGVALSATLAHFALLPVLWPRLMLPYWALTWLAACALWSETRVSDSSLAQPKSDQASP